MVINQETYPMLDKMAFRVLLNEDKYLNSKLVEQANYYLLFTTYYLLLTIYYSLLTTYYLLLTIYYLLFTTYYLLFTTYYSILITSYLLAFASLLIPYRSIKFNQFERNTQYWIRAFSRQTVFKKRFQYISTT